MKVSSQIFFCEEKAKLELLLLIRTMGKPPDFSFHCINLMTKGFLKLLVVGYSFYLYIKNYYIKLSSFKIRIQAFTKSDSCLSAVCGCAVLFSGLMASS